MPNDSLTPPPLERLLTALLELPSLTQWQVGDDSQVPAHFPSILQEQ